MDRRSSKRKNRNHDSNVTTFRVAQKATADADDTPAVDEKPLDAKGKNPHAVGLGRRGGEKSGKARAAKLTPEQRNQIIRRAAATRRGLGDLISGDCSEIQLYYRPCGCFPCCELDKPGVS